MRQRSKGFDSGCCTTGVGETGQEKDPSNIETKKCVVLTHSHPAAVQIGYVIWPNASQLMARTERKGTQCNLIILSVVAVERRG